MIPDPDVLAPPSHAPDWLDELDFSPGGPPVLHMGLTPLPSDDWLIVDDRRNDELAHKARILDEAHDQAFVIADIDSTVRAAIDAASSELLDLVTEQLRTVHNITVDPPTDCHPLEACTRIAQEDFSVVMRRDGVPWLVAAAVCFPNGWHPNDRVGRPLADVHAYIPRYADELADKVDRVFMRLRPDRPLQRRNWFVYERPELFNPGHDERARSNQPDNLFIRSERETMRMLPQTELMVFTIRTQQVNLAALADRPDVAAKMAAYFRESPTIVQTHKGVISYLPALLTQLEQYARSHSSESGSP